MSFATLVTACSGIGTILTTAVLLIRPVRERILALETTQEGIKCLLRSQMLHIYYACREERKIRQHELENFLALYAAYKKLRGNSFIDHIKSEVDEYEVIT